MVVLTAKMVEQAQADVDTLAPHIGMTFVRTQAPVEGLLITTLDQGAPADIGGLSKGDLITHVGRAQ